MSLLGRVAARSLSKRWCWKCCVLCKLLWSAQIEHNLNSRWLSHKARTMHWDLWGREDKHAKMWNHSHSSALDPHGYREWDWLTIATSWYYFNLMVGFVRTESREIFRCLGYCSISNSQWSTVCLLDRAWDNRSKSMGIGLVRFCFFFHWAFRSLTAPWVSQCGVRVPVTARVHACKQGSVLTVS